MWDAEHECHCSICQEPYDDKERVPTILVSCGHTFCAACLRQMGRNNVFGNQPENPRGAAAQVPIYPRLFAPQVANIFGEGPGGLLIFQNNPVIGPPAQLFQDRSLFEGLKGQNCPVCKKKIGSPPTPGDGQITCKNFGLLSVAEKSARFSSKCEHEARYFVCMDPSCDNLRPECLNCIARNHKKCRKDTVEKLKNLQISYENEPFASFPILDETMESRWVESLTTSFRTTVTKLVQKVCGVMRGLRTDLMDPKLHLLTGKIDLELYSMAKEGSTALHLTPNPKQVCQSLLFFEKMKNFLGSDLPGSIDQFLEASFESLLCPTKLFDWNHVKVIDPWVKIHPIFKETFEFFGRNPSKGNLELWFDEPFVYRESNHQDDQEITLEAGFDFPENMRRILKVYFQAARFAQLPKPMIIHKVKSDLQLSFEFKEVIFEEQKSYSLPLFGLSSKLVPLETKAANKELRVKLSNFDEKLILIF